MRRRQPELVFLAALLGLGLPAILLFHHFGPRPASSAATRSPGKKASASATKLEVNDRVAAPGIWIDVRNPAALRRAAMTNAWFKDALEQPLGQGFLGSWAGFLGTRGEEAGLGFEGTVLDLVAAEVLDQPVRLTWFTGAGATSTPVLTIPKASERALTALVSVAGAASGEFVAEDCPGEATLAAPIVIERWLLADHALFTHAQGETRHFARHPMAVLHAVCAPGAELEAEGADVEVRFAPARLGRDTQTFASALGLGDTVGLTFTLERDRLVPRGLTGEMRAADRLGRAGLSEGALKLLPADLPLVLSLQVSLPSPLTPEALQAFWKGGGGKREVRQVALAWQPRGDSNLPDEWALVWGRAEERAALDALFNHASFKSGEVCGQAVLASNAATFARLSATCRGATPSLLNASASVVNGLRAESSIGLGVNLGALLSQLLIDGYASENGLPPGKAAPAEIEAARRHLESLPYLGFRGTAEGARLLPGGFGS